MLGFVLLLIWFACYSHAPDLLWGKYFGLTAHEVDVIKFGGIAFTKICLPLFFLFPYIAIRLVLRRNASKAQ